MDFSIGPERFDWDEHNVNKNWNKHNVAYTECEEVFLNEPLLIRDIFDSRRVFGEMRYSAHGITNAGRPLVIIFTLRSEKIRVISMKKPKKPPKFKNEDEEFEFWSKAEALEFTDPSTTRLARFPNLKPTTMPVPLRLPVSMIERLKVLGHKKDVPYQFLIRTWIEEGLRRESMVNPIVSEHRPTYDAKRKRPK